MNNARILVVEDQAVVARNIVDRLTSEGYVVLAVVCTGADAVRKATEMQPDLVLMDVKLRGEMDGVEAAEEIHAHLDIPVIYLTGYSDEQTLQRAKTTEPFGYVIKPFEARGLRSAIEMALYKHKTEKMLRQRNRELALLNRAGLAFNSTLDQDQVLATVLEEVRHLLGVVASSIWLIDPVTGELVCQQSTGARSEIVRGWRLVLEQGIVGWVARHGESLIVPDARIDKRHFVQIDRRTGVTLCSILSVPLRVKQDVIGVLQVLDTKVDRFKSADLALLEPLASAAAIAIENARLYKEREKLIAELQEALAKVKMLGGMLPICASCKKIRDDQGYWHRVEEYIREHSEVEFSHGLCPDCARELYPDLFSDDE